MRIGGFVKQSLIDWDGVFSAVVFTKGCNFRCGYCHNPCLVLPSLMNAAEDIPERVVLEYLKSHAGWLEGVVVTGGEPTIHADLPAFLSRIKALGYKVKLDTNGSNPGILADVIKRGLADHIAMDIKTLPTVEAYSKITPTFKKKQLTGILRSICLIRESGLPYHFRTTFIDGIHSPDIISQLKTLFKEDPFVAQKFKRNQQQRIISDYT